MLEELLQKLNQALPKDYSIESPLGKGGQGAVFLGHKDDSQRVALKLFESPDPERLKREILLLQSIRCDWVVKLLDFYTIQLEGRLVPMAVYEYVDGGDLRQAIRDGERFDQGILLQLGEQIGSAIEALWQQRIVHRDIKPENIVRALDGRFVLVDVGFAQHLDLSTITPPHGQPGTFGYRSPEQCGARCRLTVHSDVFSFGVTIFEVATHEHPWGRNQAFIGRKQPVSLRELRPDLDVRFIGLVEQMLRLRPSERPTNPGSRFRQLRGA
ncbi:MAG: serine/threonine protein kinase [Deltaproteobacteria bacterium]|nr:serine/threonine protein kinase [Deltaproteobacteria bacterium]